MTTPTARQHFAALDGLRGLAALVVLIHHSLLSVPSFASAYDSSSDGPTGIAKTFSSTPLHLVWAGGEAVTVFFVLSGFVLVLPFLRRPPDAAAWAQYYPRRLVRLYLPVWGALVFAGVLVTLTYRSAPSGLGFWVDAHATYAVTARSVVENASLAVPYPAGFTSVLWSLRIEVVFSVLLPLYLWVAVRFRSFAVPMGLTALATIVLADHVPQIFAFLPVFALGVLLAVRVDDVRNLLSGAGLAVRWAVLSGGLVLITASWWSPLPNSLDTAVEAGAAGLLVMSFLPEGAGHVLGASRPIRWLGARSFALYLVHEPIVVAGAFIAPSLTPWLRLPITAATALLVTILFYRFVEQPSHRLAKSIRLRRQDPLSSSA